jgi:chitin disaccharide deacetylase
MMRRFFLLGTALLATGLFASAQNSGADLLKKMGYPADSKLLILHADDLGMSHSANLASFEALEKGWVSSASIMVPCPWFNEVAEFAKAHPGADLGLHLTLTSEWKNYRWGPVNREHYKSLLDAEGYFPEVSGPVGKNATIEDATAELAAQLAKARGAGIHFSHLDNHMGSLAQNADLFRVYLQTGRSAAVPVSISTGEIKAYPLAFMGYENLPVPVYIGPAEGMSPVEGFRKTFAALKSGVYITIVHLGLDDVELRAIMMDRAGGAIARQHDFDLVKSPEFQALLKENGIKLIGWKDVAKALDASASSPAH